MDNLEREAFEASKIAELEQIIENQQKEIKTLKNINDKLVIKNTLIQKILAALPNHVYWKDLNGVYLGCNDEQAKSLGLQKGDDVIGKTDRDLPWKVGPKIFSEVDEKVIKEKKIITVEEESTLPNGKKVIFLSSKRPLYDQDDKTIIGILGISMDITELKIAQKAEEELRRAVIILNGSMVHDLRTPIMTVSIFAKSLQKYLPAMVEIYQQAIQENPSKSLMSSQKLKIFCETGDTLTRTAEQMSAYVTQSLQTLSNSVSN